MLRNQHAGKVRTPYRELSFPEWVKSSSCHTISQTSIARTPHGVLKKVERFPVSATA